jgi:hypothetical protein
MWCEMAELLLSYSLVRISYTRDESKGLDMKGGSEKIVSIGGWSAAGMMYYSYRCTEVRYRCVQSASTPNAKPNSESPFMSSPFDTLIQV